MQSRIMLMVHDVEKAAAWFSQLLDARSAHGGPYYDQIESSDGHLLFELHRLDAEEHGVLIDADTDLGVGILVYLDVLDIKATVHRAAALGAEIVEEPHFAEQAGHTEAIVREPNGYLLAFYTPGNVLELTD